MAGRSRMVALSVGLLLTAAAVMAAGAPLARSAAGAPEPEPQQGDSQACLACHGDASLQLTLPSGESLSLFISPEALQQSVHEQLGISCDS